MGIEATSKALLRWPQQQDIPLTATFGVYRSAAGGGAVDYDSEINPAQIDAWPDGVGKVGFGLGAFGGGPFGLGHGGVGFGLGMFGLGAFGYDVAPVEFTTGDLADALYVFSVAAADRAGNVETASAITVDVVLAGEPAPPTDAEASSYDGTLVLAFSLSADDDAA